MRASGLSSLSLTQIQEWCRHNDPALNRSATSTTIHPLIDLFCGAGGMSLGFSDAFGKPFRSLWANDYNRHAAETYRANFGDHCHHGDLVDYLDQGGPIPKAEVVIGGPPCQGFSLLNKDRHADPRKQMWRPYLDVVRRSGASIFVMENVPQLLGSLEFEEIQKEAAAMGFHVTSAKLLAADYGVAQRRQRAFVIGCRFVHPEVAFPLPRGFYNPGGREFLDGKIHKDPRFLPQPQPWVTVRQAVGDLNPPAGTELGAAESPYDLHFGRKPTELSRKRYRAIPEEGMNRFDLQAAAPELTPACWIKKTKGGTDLFGRLWWDKPAFTIRTEFFKPEKGRYLHPQQHRPITHREAARFQSFPDSFIFSGSKGEIARQIGNAVPPLLAARLADSVWLLLAAREHFGEKALSTITG